MHLLVLLLSNPFLTLIFLGLRGSSSRLLLCHWVSAQVWSLGTHARELEIGARENPGYFFLLCLSAMNASLPAAPFTLQDIKHSPKTLYLGSNIAKNQTLLWLFPKALSFVTCGFLCKNVWPQDARQPPLQGPNQSWWRILYLSYPGVNREREQTCVAYRMGKKVL